MFVVVLVIVLDGLDPAGGHGDFFIVEPVGVEDFFHRYIAVFAADDLRSGLQGTEDRFDLLEFFLGDEVALVQHDGVAELDLLDEQRREVFLVFRDFPQDFTAAEFVFQTGSIDDGNDVVDVDDLRHALALGGLTHHGDGLGDGHRLADTGRLDDDVVILVGAGEVGQLLGKVLGEGTADAAVGQRDEVAVLHGDAATALFDETGVDVDLADVVDDDGDAVSVGLCQDFIEKCGLAGTEVTLDQADFTRGVFCAHWIASFRSLQYDFLKIPTLQVDIITQGKQIVHNNFSQKNRSGNPLLLFHLTFFTCGSMSATRSCGLPQLFPAAWMEQESALTQLSHAVIPLRRSMIILRMTSPTRTTRMARTTMVPALAVSQVMENTFFRLSV